MTKALPESLDRTLQTRWPDYLAEDHVTHSDACYTIVLVDLDGKHYTFRAILSLDERWTVVPISGFDEDVLTSWRGGAT